MTRLTSPHGPVALTMALAVVALAGCSSGTSSGSAVLRSAAPNAAASTWTYVDRPDAEQLQACTAGYEALVVAVDRREQPRMTVGRDHDTGPIAVWSPDASYVRRAELDGTGDGWVRVERSDAATRERVETALGPSLSEYVFAESLPPSPSDLLTSALASASGIELVTESVGESRRLVRARIDDETLDEAATDGSHRPVLIVDFLIDSTTIAAISVRDDSDSYGFRWELVDDPAVVADIPPRWSNIDTVELEPDFARESCTIGP